MCEDVTYKKMIVERRIIHLEKELLRLKKIAAELDKTGSDDV